MTEKFKSLYAYAKLHRRHLPTVALIAGFLWDSLTLGRPDQLFDNAVILFYLTVAGVCIGLLTRHRERGSTSRLPIVLIFQFAIGNLSSGLFVLYGVSGTLVGNWPFLLFLAALLIGNEFLRDRYDKTTFRIIIFYVLLLSYLILSLPVALREMGAGVFLASGFLSVIFIAGFVVWLHFLAPKVVAASKSTITAWVATILVLFNILYFTHLIPPVPLALRDIGIYHFVERNPSGNYTVSFEKPKWFEFFKSSDRVFHRKVSEKAYCFSSVFAPARLTTPIYHVWEYYDEEEEKWVERSRISFGIIGGRDEGFRGFSENGVLTDGRWRCSVKTDRGALIGRRDFVVSRDTKAEVELIQAVR